MARILINSVSNPSVANTAFKCFFKNRMERNPGDMVYTYAVMNVLCRSPQDVFVPTGYYYDSPVFSEDPEKLNSEYDFCVLPFANMLCNEWIWLLKKYSSFVNKLKMPVVVPCIGVTTSETGECDFSAETDEIIKQFLKVVLDRSSIVGVRGASSARVLERLGFRRGRHYDVIGCPSLYAYGRNLPPLQPVNDFEMCAFSMNRRSPASHWRFIDQCANLFAKSEFVAQNHDEFYHYMLSPKKMFGKRFLEKPDYDSYLSRYYRQNRLRFFLNYLPWKQYLGTCNMFVGSRIHGALLSILAGIPAVLIPFESRTRELADFHGLPMLEEDSSLNEHALRNALVSCDYSSMQTRQNENFDRYMNFWRQNGIQTVFDGCMNNSRDEFPFEKRLPTIYADDNIRAYPFNNFAIKYHIFQAKCYRRIWSIHNKFRRAFGFD